MHYSPVILIVDDMPIERAATALLLKSLGFESEQAAGGSIALSMLKSRAYDCILLDLQMPDMNGLEFAARIRLLEKEVSRKTPIIAFTSCSEFQIKQECLDAGMDNFLGKDCTDSALREALACIFERKSSENAASMDLSVLSG